MNKIGFNCDVCGRIVQGCTIVNGMKFCAKCYQETFGNNYQEDIINTKYTEHLLKENVQLKEKIESLEQENLQLKEQLDLCLNPKDFISQIRKQVCDEIRESCKKYLDVDLSDINDCYHRNLPAIILAEILDKIEQVKEMA